VGQYGFVNIDTTSKKSLVLTLCKFSVLDKKG